MKTIFSFVDELYPEYAGMPSMPPGTTLPQTSGRIRGKSNWSARGLCAALESAQEKAAPVGSACFFGWLSPPAPRRLFSALSNSRRMAGRSYDTIRNSTEAEMFEKGYVAAKSGHSRQYS